MSLLEQTKSPEFRNWFGESKLVDDDGHPLINYHGTYKDFNKFDRHASAWRGESIDQIGLWFSNNPGPGGAEMYASGEKALIYPVFLRVVRPKYFDSFREMIDLMHEADGEESIKIRNGRGSPESLRRMLISQGYDGIILASTAVGDINRELSEAVQSLASAREDEWRVGKNDREMYTVKRKRIEETVARLRKEVDYYGGSTEFDGQTVTIVFEPNQVKSAIGNSGAFEIDNADIVHSLTVEEESVGSSASVDSMRNAIASIISHEAEELKENIGSFVITTSSHVLDILKQARQSALEAWHAGSKVVDETGCPAVVFHGTGVDFNAFNTNGGRGKTYGTGAFFTSSQPVASTYAAGDSPNVMPVYLRIENPAVVDACGRNWARLSGSLEIALPEAIVPDPDEELVAALEDRAPNPDAVIHRKARITTLGELFEGELLYDDDYMSTDDIARWTRGRGYDGLIIKNVRDQGPSGIYKTEESTKPSTIYVAFNSNQVKSATGNRGTYSKEDPDITHSYMPSGDVARLKPQAFHDRQSDATYFLVDNIPAGKESAVFLHEIVHRHGRRALPEGRFEDLVQQLKAWAQRAEGTIERTVHDAAAARVATAGVAGPLADEELFAYAVEEAVARGVTPSAAAVEGSAQAWLHAVEQSLLRVLDKLLGNDQVALDAQDLVDLAYGLAQLERVAPKRRTLYDQAEQKEARQRHPVWDVKELDDHGPML